MSRIVCQFSCGAASAVATKLMLAQYGPANLVIVNAFLVEEDRDNRRFLADCERWFNHPITVLRDQKYGASAREVFRRKRFIKGPHGAPCSLELKRRLLASISQPRDIAVLGFTAEEEDRFEELRSRFPLDHSNSLAPLIDRGLSHDDCLAMVYGAGIQLPRMYRLGYDNANCKCCPKGGQAYWQNCREDFPEDFNEMRLIQIGIGPGANFLRFRSGPRAGERMSLDELPAGRGDMRSEPSFTCSFFCQMAEDEVARSC